MLRDKRILLGITGGIAAYKAAELASRLTKEGNTVYVCMTAHATEFVSPLTFETLTGQRVVTDTFDRSAPWEVGHISLAQKIDAVLIAPATANVLAKLAHGLADDMLTTTVLAANCPKLVAPAMNTGMYRNPVTQDNLKRLAEYGYTVIPPEDGHLACGDSGTGRLPHPDRIYEVLEYTLGCEKDMEGLRVLVTAGPTREALDPVRFLTNHSTGKMGYAVAKAAAERGAKVTLVSGPTALDTPYGVKRIDVTSAAEMYRAVLDHADDADLIVKAAAVGDYRPVHISEQKIKKDESSFSLTLQRNPDILKELGAIRKSGQVICGFAMETERLLEHAKEKLIQKGADLIAANSLTEPNAGFGSDTNAVTLITKDDVEVLPLMTKEEAAHRILNKMLTLK